MNMPLILRLCLILFCVASLAAAQEKLPYVEDFEKTEPGKTPGEFLVLDGRFAVKVDGGNHFLELPGAPLDSFSVQFGPAETENVMVRASIWGEAKGRRYPVFGVGLNGAAGYRLQVSPAKKAIELYKDQALKATMPYDWKSGNWLTLSLRITHRAADSWKIEAKVWQRGGAEPADRMLSAEEKEKPNAGRASVFGSPFSGLPIRFDDFRIERTAVAK